MSLDSVVQISITKETQAPSRAGFGTPLIVAVKTPFGVNTTVREYATLTEMVADGFTLTDPAHLAAAAVFNQNPRPPTVKVANRLLTHTQKFTLTVATVLNLTKYSVDIGSLGTVAGLSSAEFTSDVDATNLEITAGLKIAIDALATGFVVTDNGDGTLTLEAGSPGDLRDVAVDVGDGLLDLFDITPDPGIATDLTAIEIVDNDWYGLIIDSQSPLEIAATAAYTESRRKLFGATVFDTQITDPADSNDVLSLLQAQSFARTYGLYHPLRLSYASAAWMGALFAKDPGSATWAFFTLAGIALLPLTTTQQNTIEGKGGNVYVKISGIGVTINGILSGGDFIDITRGVDWLAARMQERIFGVLVNADKIPYTDAGVSLLEKEVKAQLTEAVDVGLLASDPEPTTTVPKVADVPIADRVARIAPDIDFEAILAGAIHEVPITGRVSV